MNKPVFWHLADRESIHDRVFEHVKGIEDNQRDVHEANLTFARLYANREEPGLGSGSRGVWRDGWQGVTENIIQQAIDAATSLIAKGRPKVAVLTDGADWSMQQLAKQLDKYLFGMFQALRVHQLMSQVFRDACIFGTGALKLFTREGQIKAERVLIDEIVVDESEVPTGCLPLQVHQVRLVSKSVLKALYPKYERQISEAGTGDKVFTDYRRKMEPDLALVIESWRRSAGPGDKGKHTICVDTACLFEEDYKRDWFPFVFYRWSSPITGFYGQGIAERLLGFQIRLNDMNDFIERCQDLIAVPTLIVDAGAMQMPIITNEIGRILPVTGNRDPKFFTPTALNAEYYSYKERLKEAALEEIGINRMTAQAARPQNIDAGVALRELSDNQSQRLSQQQQTFEDAHLETGTMIMKLAAELYAKGKAPRAFMAEKFVETIDWPGIDEMEDKFILRVEAASIMSDTPAGRKATVIEMTQYGVPLQPNEIRRLLNLPDLEQADRYANSSEEHIHWVIENLSKGEFKAPHGFMDLDRGLELVTSALLEAERLGADEGILGMFRNWIQLAEREMKNAQAAAPQPPMPMDPMMDPMMAQDPMAAPVDPMMDPAMMGAMPPMQ